MTGTAKVRTCIWVASDGAAAARLYTSLLPGSRIETEERLDNMATGEPGGVGIIDLTLAGTPYQILEAGPHQEHTDMMSISVQTEDQAETDRLWAALTGDGGTESQCGWLRDRWGVRWQIVPRRLSELMGSGSARQRQAVMAALMGMGRIDIAALEAAHAAAAA